MNAVETYLRELAEIRATGAGVPETSYYSALSNLINEVGKTLSPRVRCVLQLANRGAGNPDGGLFTSNQFLKTSTEKPIPGQSPERGVIEIKPANHDAWVTATGKQVSNYWGKYRLVLVTNYRDFVLVGQDAKGQSVKLETLRLAPDEESFWAMTMRPRESAKEHGPRFVEYLRRVLLQAAPLSKPEDVAWFLASYARDARFRIESTPLPALATIRDVLEQSLGLKFQGPKGEHFFRSTLVQTLFYGVFSAWVLWSKQTSQKDMSTRFDWKQAAWSLHVPMVKVLFEHVAAPTQLRPLGLVELLDWASGTLNRIDRASFFAAFEQAHAVQYFYEPFLQHFDPELRKQLGVWYTPPEIVKYMVGRIDAVLREHLSIPDGLADPRVYVLDPCCGTGGYLVEALLKIHSTLEAKNGGALSAFETKKAAMQRVFGFEILPAPFVVAHLQLGLLLQNLGAPLKANGGERAGVYLSNALTGWQLRDQPPVNWPELEEERKGAQNVKLEKPILVVLGNPPYNAFAGVSPDEEEGLVEVYKGLYTVPKASKAKHKPGQKKSGPKTKLPVAERHYRLNEPVSRGGWGIKKFNLDDLYIRFFRLAERRIVDTTGKGIVSFISNFSYLSDASFVIMRERFLREFNAIWIDCLNGDSRETGKLTPDGLPDPSAFSTEHNPVGITVGTAISLMVRTAPSASGATVHYRDFWGQNKRSELLQSLTSANVAGQYKPAQPTALDRYSFRPTVTSSHYAKWPKVVELCQDTPISGLQEMRHGALMDLSLDSLRARMERYYDVSIGWPAYKLGARELTVDGGQFDAQAARTRVLGLETFDPKKIRRYALYPFDNRWCYHTMTPPLWNRPRPLLAAQAWPGNSFLICRPAAERPHEQIAMTVTSVLPDYHLLRPNAVAIPLRLKAVMSHGAGSTETGLYSAQEEASSPTANLSSTARQYLQTIGIDESLTTISLLWLHALAIGYAPAYTAENGNAVRRDWPRIPLPLSKSIFLASAAKGSTLAGLVDVEVSVDGVTTGNIRSELKRVAVACKRDGQSINPDTGDLDITVGWGHFGRDGIVMPGVGNVIERTRSEEELVALREGLESVGLGLQEGTEVLGNTTLDVYMNADVFWKNVPREAWEFTVGGYQVLKKWLSYRERAVMSRGLSVEEVREFTNNTRRIVSILLLQPQLDKNYQAVKAATPG